MNRKMKEKFDHKLINKIRDVFDSHQPEFNPQDWELLKNKLPERKSRLLPLFRTIAKAAAVILIVTVGSYMLWDNFINNNTKIEDNKIVNITRRNTVDDSIKKSNYSADSSENKKQEFTAEEFQSSDQTNKINDISQNSFQQTKQITKNIFKETQDIEEQNITQSTQTTQADSIPSANTETKDVIAVADLQRNDSVVENKNENIQTLIMQPEIPYETTEKESEQKQRAGIGVEFATFTNYSPENITPGMNYGGGLAAHIPIKKRFSFNPGLIVSVYNMEFTDNQNIIDKTEMSFSSLENLIETNPDVKPSEIKLTGLDIPVNFQYRFIKRKSSGYFIELGFSSLLYLSENYSYTFASLSNTPNPMGGYSVEETATEEVASPGLKTFDFAKLINFSVGWDYNLNNRIGMTVNPYLKYPVNTLTSGDIKFGSGGLKLKLMIKPGK